MRYFKKCLFVEFLPEKSKNIPDPTIGQMNVTWDLRLKIGV
jgi:hypothetical protein